MKLFISFAFIGLMFATLSSCQSLSKEECAAADWRVIGENDGAAGYDPQDRFARHVKACARINVIPDQTLWREGYDRGLVRYCTPMSGLTAGRAGKGYANVCPVGTAEGFLRGYNLGHAAYSKNRDISSKESSINSLRYQISQQEAIGRQENDHAKLDAISDRIRTMRRQIRDYERQIDRLRFELGQVERDIDWFTADPNRSIPSRYY